MVHDKLFVELFSCLVGSLTVLMRSTVVNIILIMTDHDNMFAGDTDSVSCDQNDVIFFPVQDNGERLPQNPSREILCLLKT